MSIYKVSAWLTHNTGPNIMVRKTPHLHEDKVVDFWPEFELRDDSNLD